jgi:hypothetical protein
MSDFLLVRGIDVTEARSLFGPTNRRRGPVTRKRSLCLQPQLRDARAARNNKFAKRLPPALHDPFDRRSGSPNPLKLAAVVHTSASCAKAQLNEDSSTAAGKRWLAASAWRTAARKSAPFLDRAVCDRQRETYVMGRFQACAGSSTAK